MTSENDNVFDQMNTRGGDAYCIFVNAHIQGEGADTTMLLGLPMREIEGAPRGKGQRRSHGFTLVVDFERPGGGRYQLRGWLSITKR